MEMMRRVFMRDDNIAPVFRYLFAICGGALFFCRYKTLEYWLDLVCRLCCCLGGRVFRSGGPIEDSSLLFCTLSARMAKVEVEEAVGG